MHLHCILIFFSALVVESVNVAENSMNPSQVCATLSLPVVSPALSVTANVVFSSPGGAGLSSDNISFL